MKILYLPMALQDMAWFRLYYVKVFPDGKNNAKDSLLRTEALISENPFVGQGTSPNAATREFPVLRTPFTILYRVKSDQIEILRILDSRAQR